MVINGYAHLVDANGVRFEINQTNEKENKDHNNHHRSKTILLYVASYLEYEIL